MDPNVVLRQQEYSSRELELIQRQSYIGSPAWNRRVELEREFAQSRAEREHLEVCERLGKRRQVWGVGPKRIRGRKIHPRTSHQCQ